MEQRTIPRPKNAKMPKKAAKALPSEILLDTETKWQLNEQLWNASSKGDLGQVKSLLLKGASANADSSFEHGGMMALHHAVDSRHIGICRLLIENGAGVNRVTSYGRTPLHIAARKHYRDICTLLLAYGADPGMKDDDDRTSINEWDKIERISNSLLFFNKFYKKASDAFFSIFFECIGA